MSPSFDSSQLEVTENSLDLLKPRKKTVRKQTSFAMTDVKSECNSTNELTSQNVKRPHHKISIDDAEIILPSNGQKSSPGSCQPEVKISEKMVGLLTESERKVKVDRYLDKKKRRKGEKSVRYECRQDLASKRFRYQGRFIRFEDLHKYKGKLIIDYTGRKLVKPIFQITKVKR